MAGTTTNYSLPYPESTDLVASYPALGQDLAEDLDTILAAKGDIAGETWTGTHDFTGATVTGAGALQLIHTETFSAVSAVSLNSKFTADFDNYRVLWRLDPTSNVSLFMRLRASGSDISTSTYYYGTSRGAWSGAGSGGSGASSQTAWSFTTTDSGTSIAQGAMDVLSPFLTYPTSMVGLTTYSQGAGMFSGARFVSDSVDGFTFYPGGGTITGELSIYAYAI